MYLPPGTRLGKYELVRLLAVGGMAELHLARAVGIEGFEKRVVLKRILPQLAADADFVRMFLEEARLAATLHHPNLVQVFDIGEAAGSYFFTMEWVRGEDLAAVVATAAKRGEGLALENALAIVIGVAEGLHHAHEARGADGQPLGLVHRDVSPTNVLITYDGAVKVCDFGIAKAFARQSRLTEGVVKGKASYMSPEQCRGEALDRRSDVFALGILLHELTCGKRLFRGASDLEVLRQITERDVPRPSERVPDYPPALEAIVLRALARERDERFASAQELQLALEGFARDERLLVSSAVLGTWMHELFADKARLADERTPLPAPLPAAPVAPPTPTPTPMGEVATAAARPGNPWRAVAGVLALVAAVAGGYALSRRDAPAPAVAPAPAAAPPAAGAAPPPVDARLPPDATAPDAALPAKTPPKRPPRRPPHTPPPDERPPLQ